LSKNYYTYTDDFGNLYSFLQDDTIAAAIGNGLAGGPQPRMARSRHFFRPRKTTVKLPSGKYAQYVNGSQLFGGLAVGTVTGLGTVVGYVDEKHSSTAASI
jgi:hypothetical protein